MIESIARIVIFPIDDFEVFDHENGIGNFDGGGIVIVTDEFFILPEVHATVDENAIAFAEILSDRLSTTVPSFAAAPGDFLNFVYSTLSIILQKS